MKKLLLILALIIMPSQSSEVVSQYGKWEVVETLDKLEGTLDDVYVRQVSEENLTGIRHTAPVRFVMFCNTRYPPFYLFSQAKFETYVSDIYIASVQDVRLKLGDDDTATRSMQVVDGRWDRLWSTHHGVGGFFNAGAWVDYFYGSTDLLKMELTPLGSVSSEVVIFDMNGFVDALDDCYIRAKVSGPSQKQETNKANKSKTKDVYGK